MELTQLYYFITAAKHEHMTHAAQELHIAQPALTQSIKRLENELGVSLFSRKGRNIVLNSAGKLLLQKSEEIISTINTLPEELKAISGIEERTVKLNILAGTSIITDIIISYKKIHDNIEFELKQTDNKQDCDITLTTEPGVIEENSDSFISFSEEIFLAVPRSSRYYRRNSVYLEELKTEDFISLAGSRRFRAICDSFCSAAGFEPHNTFESDSPATVRNLIAAGMGVSFWPQYSWGAFSHISAVLLPIIKPECKRSLIFQKHTFGNRYVNDFFNYCREYMQKRIISD